MIESTLFRRWIDPNRQTYSSQRVICFNSDSNPACSAFHGMLPSSAVRIDLPPKFSTWPTGLRSFVISGSTSLKFGSLLTESTQIILRQQGGGGGGKLVALLPPLPGVTGGTEMLVPRASIVKSDTVKKGEHQMNRIYFGKFWSITLPRHSVRTLHKSFRWHFCIILFSLTVRKIGMESRHD